MDDEALHGSMAGVSKIIGVRVLGALHGRRRPYFSIGSQKVVSSLIRLLRFILIGSKQQLLAFNDVLSVYAPVANTSIHCVHFVNGY